MDTYEKAALPSKLTLPSSPAVDDMPVQSASTMIVINGVQRRIGLPGPKASYYASYTFSNNSCWLDVSLELLHVISHVPSLKHFWDQVRRLPTATLDTSVTFGVVANHFNFRAEKATLNPPAELRTLLNITRDVIHRDIMGDKYGEMSSVWVCES
jgi:hypothetical protein